VPNRNEKYCVKSRKNHNKTGRNAAKNKHFSGKTQQDAVKIVVPSVQFHSADYQQFE